MLQQWWLHLVSGSVSPTYTMKTDAADDSNRGQNPGCRRRKHKPSIRYIYIYKYPNEFNINSSAKKDLNNYITVGIWAFAMKEIRE